MSGGMLFSLLGQPSGELRTFGVSASATSTPTLLDFMTGIAMSVDASEEVVILGGQITVSGNAANTARLETVGTVAQGPTVTSSGAGSYKQLDVPPFRVPKGQGLRLNVSITTSGNAEVWLYGYIAKSKR